jgi:hypothetical protein
VTFKEAKEVLSKAGFEPNWPIEYGWVNMDTQLRERLKLAYWEYLNKSGGAGEPVEPTPKPPVAPEPEKPEAPKKPSKKEPTESNAMKALQSWKIKDALAYLDIPEHVKNELSSVAHAPNTQSVMAVWSLLGAGAQDAIIKGWIAHKKKKQSVPYHVKKAKAKSELQKYKKVPTEQQAEKAVKTWKISDVLKFLPINMSTKAQLTSYAMKEQPIGHLWDELSYHHEAIIDAYIKFMVKKHGLESVAYDAADAASYLLEADAPRIASIIHYGGESGDDLYKVEYPNGEVWRYSVSPGVRDKIERNSRNQGRAVAIIKKAKSHEERVA